MAFARKHYFIIQKLVRQDVSNMVHWAFPVRSARGAYTWADIEIRESAGRGKGLFARRDLPADTVIPVFGFIMSRFDLDCHPHIKQWENLDPTVATYSFTTISTAIKLPVLVVHPWFSKHQFIDDQLLDAGYHERVNAGYQHAILNKRSYGFLRLVEPVSAGSEILWHYGTEYQRSYRVGQEIDEPDQDILWTKKAQARYDAIRDWVVNPRAAEAVGAFKAYLRRLGGGEKG